MFGFMLWQMEVTVSGHISQKKKGGFMLKSTHLITCLTFIAECLNINLKILKISLNFQRFFKETHSCIFASAFLLIRINNCKSFSFRKLSCQSIRKIVLEFRVAGLSTFNFQSQRVKFPLKINKRSLIASIFLSCFSFTKGKFNWNVFLWKIWVNPSNRN